MAPCTGSQLPLDHPPCDAESAGAGRNSIPEYYSNRFEDTDSSDAWSLVQLY
nr:unnamed protein product [Digitaria exilis]